MIKPKIISQKMIDFVDSKGLVEGDIVPYLIAQNDYCYKEMLEEINKIISKLEAIDRDASDVRDFTRRVCELIVEYRSALQELEEG